MKRSLIIIFLAIALLAALIGFSESSVVYAQDTGAAKTPLVPCGSTTSGQGECYDICQVLELGNRIYNFIMFRVVPGIAMLLFLYAGFLIMVGNTELIGEKNQVLKGRQVLNTTVIGLVITYLAWVIVTFLLTTFLVDTNTSGTWYKLECQRGAAVTEEPGPEVCDDLAALAKSNNVPYPAVPAKETTDLNDCITKALGGTVNLGSIHYVNASDTCSYTRGQPICGSCGHTTASCHYGGATGTSGSLAIDYGGCFSTCGGKGEPGGDAIIQAAKQCGAKAARCEGKDPNNPNRVITLPCNHANTDHVHVTAPSCSGL